MNRYSIINKNDTHACMEQSKAGDWVPYADYAEAMRWKNEDPRMLREQCRISDVAFQHLHEENKRLRAMMPNIVLGDNLGDKNQ